MNHFIWIGIVVWGVLVTLFGMGLLGGASLASSMPPHDVAFLVAGGMLSCLIGALGLAGLLRWLPGARQAQKTVP